MREKIIKIISRFPRLAEFLKKLRKKAIPQYISRAVSYEQYVEYARILAKKIPNEFDVIVGVPRSGLLVANILSTKFGRPLSTPDLIVRREYWNSKNIRNPKKIEKILIVEDSVGTGKSLKESFQKIKEKFPEAEIKTASLFAYPKVRKKVDYLFDTINKSPILESQMIHETGYKFSVDMDGILCEDVPQGIGLDEEKYVNWLKTAKPFMIPTQEIDTIITGRLNKHRGITEKWLKENGVRYKKLEMIDLESDYGKTVQKIIEFKIEVLKKSKSLIFWESSLRQAFEIFKRTKKPVLCVEEMILFK